MDQQTENPLAPSLAERLSRLRSDLRAGVPCLLVNGDKGLLFVPIETLTTERLGALRGLGPVIATITERRATTLKARSYDGDIARVRVPDDADLGWLEALADPARDLSRPLLGPLASLRDDAADLYRFAVRLTKEARLLPAILAVSVHDGQDLVRDWNLQAVSISDIAGEADGALTRVVAAKVPLALAENTRLQVYRPEDGGEEHYAIVVGRPDTSEAVLARLHSACFTGDLLGSLKCDCGAQLRGALETMAANPDGGILLYLNQEGRGIGLANKMRAYALQDQGFDTVEANHRLGFEDDERDFRLGAAILRSMNIARVRLLTNNPAKVEMLQSHGVEVIERVPLRVGETPQNRKYLRTKADKSGHLL